MLDSRLLSMPEGERLAISLAYREDEQTSICELIRKADLDPKILNKIQQKAITLVKEVRRARKKATGIDSFLTQYSLSSEEGIALMCLAEALLRVPDNPTIDSLIKDKLTMANWKSHIGLSDSFFINATTWALMLTGKVLDPEKAESSLSKSLFKLMNRSGEGLVRAAVDKAIRIMSKQFVMGRSIEEAIKRAKKKEAKGYCYSYDMLGEAALTKEDAERYFRAYQRAIDAIGSAASKEQTLHARAGISIKLSALHPRYQEAQKQTVFKELVPTLLELARTAKSHNIGLTIDAEESERLELSLDVIERVFSDSSLAGWEGFGMAVQSYQKRAYYVLDWIAQLARAKKRRFVVRLIKGAYWDSEIKKTQMQGFKDYPVFTRKAFTDVSFQACAKKILTLTDVIYPQFATHNAYSVALILSLVGEYRDFEFQCLHGMGTELYEQIISTYGIRCRIYAPVGSHEDLLPYLVRRLLENGANSSFVNRIVDEKSPIESLVEDPVAKAELLLSRINANIPLPSEIFLPERVNSKGFDFTNRIELANLQQLYTNLKLNDWEAKSKIEKSLKEKAQNLELVYSPQDNSKTIGKVTSSTQEELESALEIATTTFGSWSTVSVNERALCLERYADLLEKSYAEIFALLCLEAGKTWNDSLAELREAVDFCRYYAVESRRLLSKSRSLHGYTGETNELSLHPRGPVLCISPWNFPLAIFTGQIVAALVTGNTVLAKPAEQTPLIASLAVKLMHEAGIPRGALQLLIGPGETVGAPLVADQRIKAVIFTGSTQTATNINQSLAKRGGELIPLIAETGGQNAMIVDSSALLEQVVVDAVTSAFGSAGQRCSALRVIYIQEEVYPRFIQLLRGAMSELKIGDPGLLSTDIGPVIDSDALKTLKNHVQSMTKSFKLIYQCKLPESCQHGSFMPPTAIAIDSISTLKKEIFGPVLHVISYKRKDLDKILTEISSTKYGLTLGIHTRISEKVRYIRERLHVGNCYVNRNMIGAVVGLQPFGGEGLSGTGPKAGGPYYLLRLCQERTFTVDTTAAGGNASLMSIPE